MKIWMFWGNSNTDMLHAAPSDKEEENEDVSEPPNLEVEAQHNGITDASSVM